MSGDVQVRFCERPGVRFPRATHRNIYVRSERAGLRVMASMKAFIEKRLKLKINTEKSKVAKPHEGKFLGLKFQKLKGQVFIGVSEEALRRCETRLKELTPRNWGQSIDDCLHGVNVFLQGWLGYFAICSERHRGRLGRIDGHLRRRLRAILLKQWKRRRHIINQLRQLGVPAPLARVDIYAYRRSWWALTQVRAVCRGLTNAHFARRGLFALHENWKRFHERIWGIDPTQLTLELG
jgi:RNA-directed DNA polymerase